MIRAGLFGGDWEDYSDALQDAAEKAFWDSQSPSPDGAGASALASTLMNDPDTTGGPGGLAVVQDLSNGALYQPASFYPMGDGDTDNNIGRLAGMTLASAKVISPRLAESIGQKIDMDQQNGDATDANTGIEAAQQVARASYAAADVISTVNQANQLAADICARYAPGKPPPSAVQQANDQEKIKSMQDQLTGMKYGDLPQQSQSGSSLLDNIMGASNYLYQATMNAHLGSVSKIPPAAGGAMFGFDDGTLPPDTLAPQRIGHFD